MKHMTNSLKSLRDAQQRYLDYLDTIKEGQKGFTEALEFWGNAFGESNGTPSARLPLEPLPPKQLVETSFDFIERMIAAQKQFAFALVESAV
jgi:hypothetical protein